MCNIVTLLAKVSAMDANGGRSLNREALAAADSHCASLWAINLVRHAGSLRCMR